MSVSVSGELVFKVTFDQHGFPASMYTRAAIIHTCAGQIYSRSPFSNSGKPSKLDNFKVELVSKKRIRMKEIHQITSTELLVLKQQYNKYFLRYWRKPGGSSKFKPISMDAFKSRFFKPTKEGISNPQNTKPKVWYCDTCGALCPQKQVIAGFGFSNNCIKK